MPKPAAVRSAPGPTSDLRFTTIVLVPILLFWSLLFTLGAPKPNFDDVYFVGAAISLAERGELVNPYLADLTPRAVDRYYLHPPFYPYALAGWLRLLGTSTDSLRSFQIGCGILFSLSVAVAFRRRGFPPLQTFLVVLFFTAWTAPLGLRPDAFVGALLALGMALLDARSRLSQAAGLTIVGFAVAAVPPYIAPAVPLLLLALGTAARREGVKPLVLLRRRIPDIVGGAGIVTMLFVAAIHGEVGRFFSDYLWSASLYAIPIAETLSFIAGIFAIGYKRFTDLPVLAWYVVLAGLAFWHRGGQRRHVALGVTAGAAGILLMLLYPRTLNYGSSFFFLWVGIAFMIPALPWGRPARWTAASVSVLLFLANNSTEVVMLLCREPVPVAEVEAVGRRIPALAGRRILFDEYAARLVFDFRMPEGALAWNFSHLGVDHDYPMIDEKKPGDAWVISVLHAREAGVPSNAAPARIFGREFHSIVANPGEIILLEPDDAPPPGRGDSGGASDQGSEPGSSP